MDRWASTLFCNIGVAALCTAGPVPGIVMLDVADDVVEIKFYLDGWSESKVAAAFAEFHADGELEED